MANFAKAQLLKYGWTEGKGLGKTENGIPEAIRPKLKFDNAGIGYDSAEQFTYHWWENVFNEAAKNILVKSDNEGVSVKVIDKDTDNITIKNSGRRGSKKKHKIQYGNFTKGALSNDESMDTLVNKINHVQLTDKELFEACGGRTAHKGARHGLNLSGKLARIAEQEKQLLSKMNPSNVGKKESSSNISSSKEYDHEFELVKSRKRVESKRKIMKTDPESETNIQKTVSVSFINESEDPQPGCSYTINPNAGDNLDTLKSKRGTKKSKKNNCEQKDNPFRELLLRNDPNFIVDDSRRLDISRSNKIGPDDNANTIEQDDGFMIPPITEEPLQTRKSKKSRKKEKRRINELTAKLDTSCVIDESTKIAKKRRRVEGQQIVENILMTTLEECGSPAQKYKKIKNEEISKSTYDADKLNAKILKRKKNSYKKKQVQYITFLDKNATSHGVKGAEGAQDGRRVVNMA